MAKHKSKGVPEGPTLAAESRPDHEIDYRVADAAHTLMRAGEIIKDKKMLAAVRKHAKTKAEEHRELAERADHLAKMGRISPKAMEKLKA